jgi:hypothetical protein
MRYLVSILLAFFSIFTYGQNAKLLKQKIQNHMQNSIKDPTIADYWMICNTDNSFYKNDTISLFNYGTDLCDTSNCCSFVIWYFLDKTHFFSAETIVCNEPNNSRAKYKNKYYCKLKWKIDGNELFIIKKSKSNVEKYLVIDFTIKYIRNELIDSYVLKLKRSN